MNKNHDRKPSIILLVEDEESLRRSIAFSMMRLGYRVHACGSVEEALEVVNNHKSQNVKMVLIVTDLQLPGANGMEIVRSVSRSNDAIPILVITGHASREIRAELGRMENVAILDKPFDLDEFMTKVERVLSVAEKE